MIELLTTASEVLGTAGDMGLFGGGGSSDLATSAASAYFQPGDVIVTKTTDYSLLYIVLAVLAVFVFVKIID